MFENNSNNKSQIIVGKLIDLVPYYDDQYIMRLWFGEEEYKATDAIFGRYNRKEDLSNLNPCHIFIQPETAGRDELLEEYHRGCLVAVKGEAYSVLDRNYGCIRYGIKPSYVCVVTEEVDDTFQHIIKPAMPESKKQAYEPRHARQMRR